MCVRRIFGFLLLSPFSFAAGENGELEKIVLTYDYKNIFHTKLQKTD
jgi:hypothetical protein